MSNVGAGGCASGRALSFLYGVTVSPDGRNAYAAANGPIGIFDRDPATGALAQKLGPAGCVVRPEAAVGLDCSPGTGLLFGGAVAVSPDGMNLYGSGEAVTVFDRDPTTGAVTQHAGLGGCFSEDGSGGTCSGARSVRNSQSVTISPDGENVYVASMTTEGVAIFDRDPATGALTQKPGAAGCVTEDGSPIGDPPPAGQPDTRVRACSDGNGLVNPNTVVVSPDGRNVYVAALVSDALTTFDRDPATGALTQKPGMAGCISHGGVGGCAYAETLDGAATVTLSPDGKDVYVTAPNSDAVTALDRNPLTGLLARKPGTAGCVSDMGSDGVCANGVALNSAYSVTVSPDGKSVYVGTYTLGEIGLGDGVAILDRNPQSGALTQKPGAAGCVSDDGTGPGGCASGSALAGLTSVTVSPDGKNVYASAFDDDAVSIFDRTPTESTPPDTTIFSGPAEGAATVQSTATFTFGSTEPGSSFRCSIDGAPPFACGSPLTTAPLSAGPHSFSVAATDLSVNADPTPATRTFIIVLGAPPDDGGGAAPVPLGGGLSDGSTVTPGEEPPVITSPVAMLKDLLAPTVTRFGMTNATFAVGSNRTPIAGAAAQVDAGTAFRYALSESAQVRIAITARRLGRRSGGRCVAPSRRLRRARRCTRLTTRGALTRTSRAGANRVAFSGRIGSRALRPGRYQARLTATDAARNISRSRTAFFRIVRR